MGRKLCLMAICLVAQFCRAESRPTNYNYDDLLKKAARLENSTSPLPCVRPPRSEGWFEFVVLRKDSAQQQFDQADVCRLIETYANHLYGSLAKFWPLKQNLGIEVTIENNRAAYNASFQDNLQNPYYQQRFGLIYIAGIPSEPQKYVWSHEYGHAVLNETVRSILNRRYSFDSILRHATQTSDRGDEKIESDIAKLKASLDSFREANDKLGDQISKISERMILEFKEDRRLGKIKDAKEAAIHQTENLNIDIRNFWMKISNSQGGNLDNYPEGKEIIEQSMDQAEREFEKTLKSGGFVSLIKPNPVEIKKSLTGITAAKIKIAELRAQLDRIPRDLDAKIQANSSVLEFDSAASQKLTDENNRRNKQITFLEGQIAKLKVQAGIQTHERLAREGIRNLPGVSIYLYYHEFFADLFAAVVHDDPNVIGDALLSIDGKDMSDYADARRFSPIHPEKFGFANWTPPGGDAAHLFFTPVRAAFGGEAIKRINREHKGKAFLKKALDLIALQLVGYVVQINNNLLLPYEPFVQEFSSFTKGEDLVAALDKANKDLTLSSAFLKMSDVRDWCTIDFPGCQKMIVTELKRGSDGLFSTSVKIREANENLYGGLENILNAL